MFYEETTIEGVRVCRSSPGEAWKPVSQAVLNERLLAAEKTLSDVRQHILGYYEALDRHQHGGVAQNEAFSQIEKAMGMQWDRGATLKLGD